MIITDEMVDHLARLSRLRFEENEKEEIKSDLQKMIAFVEKLQEVDTTGVPPTMHMTDNANILREDEVKPMISREEALLNAPNTDGTFFKVPKVIKK